jgi:ABC-type multidrug transport system ATPase subunit
MTNLYVDSVIKQFANHQVLTDVFLSCNRGEIIGLLGRNGCGKSTLLRIIFGSTRADTKFVKIGDHLICSLMDNKNLVKYLPQDFFLPSHIKIRSIIDLFCDNKIASQIKEHEVIKAILSKKIRQISGGEQRFLEILMILYSTANFILLDEPFNGLSPIYRDEIKTLIKDQSRSKGFIITDHDYKKILELQFKFKKTLTGLLAS